jgi:hypothetical protein
MPVSASSNDILSEAQSANRTAIVDLLIQAYWMEIETVMSYIANSINPDGTRPPLGGPGWFDLRANGRGPLRKTEQGSTGGRAGPASGLRRAVLVPGRLSGERRLVPSPG